MLAPPKNTNLSCLALDAIIQNIDISADVTEELIEDSLQIHILKVALRWTHGCMRAKMADAPLECKTFKRVFELAP